MFAKIYSNCEDCNEMDCVRGLTPPHRVKSISMATFTPDEIEFLKSHGNDTCAKTWLGLWDPKRAVHQDQRELMIDKYERKRYFLEPASPLKSLPNAAKLTPSSNNSSAAAAATHTQNLNNLNNNNNNMNGFSNGSVQAMNQKNTALDNGFQNISLTPPSSRSSNGNHGGNLNGYGPSAISRPNHQPQQNGHHYDAFSNGINGLSSLNATTNGNSKLSFNGSAANSETSSCNSNGFTPESDFVADFSSATIFDATSTNSVASSGSGGSSGTNNGYAKIQSINTAAHMMNGNAVGPLMNGNGNMQNGNGSGVGGGFATPTNGNSENFADFDHAPIFNAAEFNSKPGANNNQQQQFKTNNINNNNRNNNNYLFFAPTTTPTSNQQQQKQTNFYANTMFELSNDFNSISLFSPGISSPEIENEDLPLKTSNLTKNIFNKCSNNNISSSMAYSPYSCNNNNNNIYNVPSNLSTTSNPYNGQQQQHQKFTPLAMAAHATAMAVLGHNSSNLNGINSPFGIQSSEWGGGRDAWQQQVQQDSITASQQQLQQHQQQQQQQWPGLSSVSNNNVNNNNATKSYNHPLTISVGASAASIEADSDSSHQHSNRNSWSLPISNSTTSNSLSSSATFNSSSSSTASPPADRYAALKDLDEQLRESKAVAAAAAAAVATSVVDSFGGTQSNSNVNPFKTVVNSHQTQQIANPFQANPSQNPVATSLFGGGMPQNQQLNGLTNGFIGGIPNHQQQQHQQQQQQQAFYNFANGFAAPQTTNMYSAGPNGCGFGFGTMQQPIANGVGAAFNNPFAATGTLNSNNPFL
ncbi:uncharacterized protein DDB_G0283357 isoform X2 [Eupeodes corollae]|uniref:uncharacterized protein DDB_G0283357 isoform X2 n=1 Tax=Eupeodes corollae TaxID=290404 RepID=UPI002490D749|nr:uncharacterized protein DDB_G0283357 isoform X2 [Eupeodes corollae]